MRVTLFILVLNEIEGMKAILPRIRPEWYDQILVVDGGSRDGTLEVAKAQGLKTYGQRHKGIRFAYIEAWPLIRGDVVITFSPDGNCPAEPMGILRTYRTALFLELALDKEESYAPEKLLATTIGIEPLLSIRCAKRRLRVSEIPVPEPPRIGGKRKLQMFRWGGAYLLQIVREIYHWR